MGLVELVANRCDDPKNFLNAHAPPALAAIGNFFGGSDLDDASKLCEAGLKTGNPLLKGVGLLLAGLTLGGPAISALGLPLKLAGLGLKAGDNLLTKGLTSIAKAGVKEAGEEALETTASRAVTKGGVSVATNKAEQAATKTATNTAIKKADEVPTSAGRRGKHEELGPVNGGTSRQPKQQEADKSAPEELEVVEELGQTTLAALPPPLRSAKVTAPPGPNLSAEALHQKLIADRLLYERQAAANNIVPFARAKAPVTT